MNNNSIRKNQIYGNWLVLHPDGFEMFRCTFKKAGWYLKRELAEIVKDYPPVIKLLFKPNGPGWRDDSFSLHQKVNECVVCGTREISKLTRHHIVPSMYKKFFPQEFKIASSHDVVSICREHHNDYEIIHALKLKEEIAKQYGIPLNSDCSSGLSKAIKLSKAYMFNDNIPKSRKEDLIIEISLALDREEFIDMEEVEELSRTDFEEFNNENRHGKLVVEKLEDFQEFVEMWRRNFFETMCPKFMPELWSISRPINMRKILNDR